MPRIEADFLPSTPDDLRFVPILSDAPSARGAAVVVDNGVETPVIVDAEGELFRHMRVAGKVFPLNVVADRDANVAHIDSELQYDLAGEAALAELEG